jgi:membrane-bound serine protease (ClpP class)
MGLAALCAVFTALIPPAPSGDEVLVARIRNEIIHPLTAQYLVDSIQRADEEHAALLLIELDTPGGLVDSMKEILQAMEAARTPIAVYVAPSAARAASAGFVILIAADVAAMAPGTNTGAAHPIDAAGVAGAPEKKDDVGLEKAENDLAAFVRSTAEHRKRNVELSEKAVRESASFTEREALDQNLIDVVSNDRSDLLARLDGRKIERFDGREAVLHTRGPVRELEKTFLQSVLGPILHPQLVLLLLGLGVMGLYVEISHPGMIFPGVIGVLCLLLFGLAFHFLPMNAVGVALVILGLGLFILELKFTSYGALTFGGFACLLLGLLMIFPRDVPALRVSLAFVLPLAITVGGVMSFFLVLVARAQRTPVATGLEGMVGETGRAIGDVAAEGKVYVHGETWDARSAAPVASGADVRVLAVEGSRLVIEKKESIA